MIHIDNVPPTLSLIDFGLARLFRNPATYLHIPFTTNHSIIGTLPFASINSQQGNSQSRRDDLESLAYTIIYSALGNLPWTGNSAGNKEKAVLRKKHRSQWKSCAKAYPLPFANSPPTSVLLALMRSQTISCFIPSFYSAQKP
jgi:serine/threonine protein kinase